MIKVSIVIPLYNRASLVGETLESIRAQTYSNWECIIVDDGSTDNSFDVAREIASSDSRFSVVKRPADRLPGGNASRNYGFELSSGKYINWFDSDDLMHSEFISAKVRMLEAAPSLDAVISRRALFFDNPLKITSREDRTFLTENVLTDFLLREITWYLQDVMWRKDYLADKELFNENLLSGQDRDFHIRMLLHKPKLEICALYLTLYRSHAENITSNFRKSKHLNISHLEGMLDLFEKLQEQNALTPEVKQHYFRRALRYLPFISSRSERKMLRTHLAQVSLPGLPGLILWTKYHVASLSYRLTGKGYMLTR